MQRHVVIVSEDLVEPWDEGIKKFTVSIGGALASDHAVTLINVDRSGLAAARNGSNDGGSNGIRNVGGTRTFVSPMLRREVARARPDVIVYVPSPSSTVASVMRSWVLRRQSPSARIGMVALIPRRHGSSVRPLLRAAAPDLIFVPSYASLLHLCDLGIAGDVLPIGVDLARFRRAAPGEKEQLRREHGIPEDQYMYLHVGHLTPNRNLGVLAHLAARQGVAVVVVGSTSTLEDVRIRDELESAGVRVIRRFVPVHEYYRMADAYVFPTVHEEGCVEIPLSVFEALASGIPVVARPFGGLRDFVPAGEDVLYADSEEELLAHADVLRAGPLAPVRDMSAFGWRSVADRLLARLCNETERSR